MDFYHYRLIQKMLSQHLERIGAKLPRKALARARAVSSQWHQSMGPMPPYHEVTEVVPDWFSHQCTTWSSDGELVAACCYGNFVHVYRTATGERVYRVKVNVEVCGMSFVSGGPDVEDPDLVLIGCDNPYAGAYAGAALVVALRPDGTQRSSIALNVNAVLPQFTVVFRAYFARDSATVALLYYVHDGEMAPPMRLCVVELDREAGHCATRTREIEYIQRPNDNDIYGKYVALSPDGKKLALLMEGNHGWTSRVTVFEIQAGMDAFVARTVFERRVDLHTYNGGDGLVAWNSSSSRLAFVDGSNRVYTVNLTENGFVQHVSEHGGDVIMTCVWSRDRLVICPRHGRRDAPFPLERSISIVDTDTGTVEFVDTLQRRAHASAAAAASAVPSDRLGLCLTSTTVAPDGRGIFGFETPHWTRVPQKLVLVNLN